MPYIKQERRIPLMSGAIPPDNPGDLNFLLTTVLTNYVAHNGKSYQTYNDCLGALEGAKLEFYRRKVAVYENLKIQENGDV